MNRDNVWIQTFSGIKFNLFNPSPDDILIEDIAHALSNLARFNGHTAKFYSVAQHSVYCALKAPERLALAVLLHDAAEAYLGDIVSPLKALLDNYVVFENAIYALIAKKYLPTYLTVEDYKEISNIDLRMLATEKFQLMGGGLEWESLKDISGYSILIEYMSPNSAEKAFLACFKRFSI